MGSAETERAFRKHAEALVKKEPGRYQFVSCEGEILRGSFDHLENKKAIQVLSAFLSDNNTILAHVEIEVKHRHDTS